MRGGEHRAHSSTLRFDVISMAYERTSVIVTSDLPLEQWTEVLLSERLTGVNGPESLRG